MLKIRTEQMLAFQSSADSAFIRKLAAHLREKHGDTGVHLPTVSPVPGLSWSRGARSLLNNRLSGCVSGS